MAAFTLSHCQVAATETVEPTNSKIFILFPFTEKNLLVPGTDKWKELWPLEINWYNILMVQYY